MRLVPRLVLGSIGILTVTVAVLLYTGDRWIRRDLERSFAAELERQAHVVAAALSRPPTDLNMAAHRYGALLGRRVTFIAPDGAVLGDSDFDDASLALLDNHRERPEIAAALAGRTGVAQRTSASTDRAELKVAIPAWPGAVRISAPLEQLDGLVTRTKRAMVLATLAALLLGTALSALAAQTLARPIRQLARSAKSAAAGGTPVYPHSTIPEVTELVRSVHSMHQLLEARIGELHREREETVALIEAMKQGVLAANARGEILVCNPAMRRLLGFDPDDEMPNLRELFHRRNARDVVNAVLQGKAVHNREIELDDRSVVVTARPLPDGGAVFGVLDVSDVKRLQNIRRDFVANVSHELKTPLTNIVGYTETLIGEDVDPETRHRFLAIMHENALRMKHLIDDLLDLARLESGSWSPRTEPLDLRATALDAWSQFERDAGAKGVALELQVPPDLTLQADPQAVRQVLDNLLDNALRHTPGGGTITVAAAKADGGSDIVITDTGSGIPPEHVSRVFERFYRVDPGRSRKEGGTGLGLAIVKHLVEAHGGRVSIESELGQGTTVRIHLPSS